MTDNPQQVPAGFGESESASLAELEEQLRKIRAEKAILELQLREYSEQLDKKVEERTRELEAINRIAATVSRSLNLDVILRESLSKVLELLELEVGGIFLVEEEKATMSLMIHQGLPSDVVELMSSIPFG